jgi:hypothetical protein
MLTYPEAEVAIFILTLLEVSRESLQIGIVGRSQVSRTTDKFWENAS